METVLCKRSCGEWKIAVANSFEEIEAIRPAWEQMQRNESHPVPNADIDRYLSVTNACGDDVRPCVLLLERNDCPAAMVVGRVEKRQLEFKLGYKTLFSPSLRCLSIEYGGILGSPQNELCSLLVEELAEQLRSRKVEVVYFNQLRTDTAFYQAVRKMPGFLIRGSAPRVQDHWRMSVPKSMDQFYLSRSGKSRHNLRRAVRKFEADFPGKHDLVEYTAEADVDEFIRIAADISSGTYQNALGVGMVNDERTRSLITATATHGWFRGHVLLAGDKPCAFQLALCYERICYLVNMGYDPALRPYWPGTILFLRFLESLCDDPSMDAIDFYFGDAWYKKRYGTEHWPEACVHVFAPRPHLILLNMLQNSTMRVNAGLKYVANRIGVKDWAKRRWRDMLRKKSSRMNAG